VFNGGFALRNTCALLCVWLSFAVVSCHAQSQTFKGHRIGESFSDFLKAEPVIQEKLTYCQSTTPHQLTPDEIAKLSPEELRSRYGAWAKSFKQYLKIEANYNKPNGGLPSQKDQEQAEYQSKCSDLLNLIAKGEGELTGVGVGPNTFAPEFNEYFRQFTFEGGHLIKFSLDIVAGFGQARDDISARLGVIPVETTTPYQNGFGANWNDHTASWDDDSVHVVLFLSDNPARESARPSFLAESQYLHRKSLQIQKNAPRPLD
jgi:hypothetical protein